MKFKCKRCNNIFERSFNEVKNQDRHCPYCDVKVRHNIDNDFVDSLLKDYKDGLYIRKSDYKNSRTRMDIVHEKEGCFHKFKMSTSDIQRGKICPNCLKNMNRSENEEIIFNFLQENEIKFDEQKTFEDCVFKRLLSFDFYIEELDLIIEFDGAHHFFKKYKKERNNYFEDYKKRDQYKNNYCKENNINLLRISFKEKNNLLDILQEVLHKDISSTTILKYNLLYIHNGIIENSKRYYTNVNKRYFN